MRERARRMMASGLGLAVCMGTAAGGIAAFGPAAQAAPPFGSALPGAQGYAAKASAAGLTGWVLSDGRQLGVAKLANGTTGLCLDASPSRQWPTKVVAPTTVTGQPKAGYLLSTWMGRAQSDADVAAALWVTVGKDLGLNSDQAYAARTVSKFAAEFPAHHARMQSVRKQMLQSANTYAPPASGYKVPSAFTVATTGSSAKGGTGTVTGIGVKSASGAWVPNASVKLSLSGDAKWTHNNAAAITVTTGTQAKRLAWHKPTPGVVTVKQTISGLGNARYKMQPAYHRSVQRVGFAAGQVSVSAAKRADNRAWVRIHKVDAKTHKSLPGATFNVWWDNNHNGTRQASERQVTVTTNRQGRTPVLRAFAGGRVCIVETKAPHGYVTSSTTLCRTARGTSTAGRPMAVTLANRVAPKATTPKQPPQLPQPPEPRPTADPTPPPGDGDSYSFTVSGDTDGVW